MDVYLYVATERESITLHMTSNLIILNSVIQSNHIVRTYSSVERTFLGSHEPEINGL